MNLSDLLNKLTDLKASRLFDSTPTNVTGVVFDPYDGRLDILTLSDEQAAKLKDAEDDLADTEYKLASAERAMAEAEKTIAFLQGKLNPKTENLYGKKGARA